MKFWLLTSLNTMPNTASEERATERGGDYECIEYGYIHSAPLADDALRWDFLNPLIPLQQMEPVYWQMVCEDRWLVCHPEGTGRLLVMDGEGKTFLDQLAEPTTLNALLSADEQVSYERARKILRLFLDVGIVYLRDQATVASPLPQDEELGAWLHITNSCNLGCAYCYITKTSANMSEQTALRAIDAIFRSAQRQHFRRVVLRYAGGEASLRLDRVLAVHDYAYALAQERGIQLRGILMSNGVLLTAEMIEQLKERRISVMISLDGLGRYHDSQRPFLNGRGSFKSVESTIARLLTHDLTPSISVTVSRRNLEGLSALMAYLLERNLPFNLNFYRENAQVSESQTLQFTEQEMINGIRAALRVVEDRLPEHSLLGSFIDKANLAAPHRYTCGVGHNYLVVDQHGGVAKCHAAIEQRVTTIEAEDPLWDVQNDRRGVQGLPVHEKVECLSCSWRFWCTGGCPLLTYRVTGRYDLKSPNCRIYKALFPELLRLEGLRMLKYVVPLEI